MPKIATRSMFVWMACGLACLALLRCDPAQECKEDKECTTGKVCRENKCIVLTPSCSKDADCGSLEYCLNQRCVLKPTGETPPPPTDGGQPETPGSDETVTEDEFLKARPCVSNLDCNNVQNCQVRVINNALVKRCISVGGRAIGAGCANGSDCLSGLCSGSACVAVCLAHRHCAASQECKEIKYLPGFQMSGCVKGKRTVCTGDADCGEDQFCQANAVEGSDKVTTSCKARKSPDKDPPGSVCTPGNFPGNCASHLCDPVQKKCLEICTPGLPCTDKKLECRPFPFFKGEVNACLPALSACKKQGDCPQGTTCAAFPKGDKVEFFCVRERASQPKKVGETCRADAQFPGECQTQMCVRTGKVESCVATCQSDDDCKGDKANPRCGFRIFRGVRVPSCIPDASPCANDSLCPASQPVCALVLQEGQLLKQCSKGGPGTKKTGEACDPSLGLGNQCLNRFCESGTHSCIATCEQDADCGKEQECRDVVIESGKIKGCVPKTNAQCEHLRACGDPDVCRAERETDAGGKIIVIGRCKKVGGKPFGDPCTPNPGKLSQDCSSQICLETGQLCSSLCRTDADCPTGSCKGITLEGNPVKVCDPTCAHSKDCPQGQTCRVSFDNQKKLRPLCVSADAKKAKLGDSCEYGKGQCDSGFCSPVTLKCTSVCSQDSDCASGSEICGKAFVAAANDRILIPACVPSYGGCRLPGHCFSNTVCRVTTKGNRAFTECTAPQGSQLKEGETCKTDQADACQTALCDPKSLVCTATCTKDEDCKDATRNKCGTITIQGTNFNACIATP